MMKNAVSVGHIIEFLTTEENNEERRAILMECTVKVIREVAKTLDIHIFSRNRRKADIIDNLIEGLSPVNEVQDDPSNHEEEIPRGRATLNRTYLHQKSGKRSLHLRYGLSYPFPLMKIRVKRLFRHRYRRRSSRRLWLRSHSGTVSSEGSEET